MNIASSGVKGYEYQYLASVSIALNIGIDNINSLLIEKKGTEDAFLQINTNASQVNIEIQVKRESSILDISKLSRWLTHFQEGKSNNNLLYRIEKDDALALFITKSRCSDETVQLKKNNSDISPHKIISINTKWNSVFTKALSEYSDTTAKFIDSRRNFCKLQAKTFKDKKHTSGILKKVIIWEEVTDENLSADIKSLLNIKYKIPQSQTNSVQLDLLEIVRKGRDEGINIISLFNALINQKKAGHPLIGPDYKKRPEEDRLYQELRSTNLLLLTGTTLCGKSELAKQIASFFFAEGYNYTIQDSLEIIIQFFSENPIEDKIAILEDPWGHLEKSPESLTTWRKIENFLANVPFNHKLIITSRREIIQDIQHSKKINLKKINGRPWHDLTLSDSSFLISYWENISEERKLSEQVIQSIITHLVNTAGEDKLQIGQLQFLAGSDEVDLRGKTGTELEHIARMNSKEISDSIRNRDQKTAELISILALTSTITTGIHKRELAYILSDDENLYSRMERDFWSSGSRNEEIIYPKYQSEPELTGEIKLKIEYL